jgi:UPF0716 family protein affecting phage T7 exclusion
VFVLPTILLVVLALFVGALVLRRQHFSTARQQGAFWNLPLRATTNAPS